MHREHLEDNVLWNIVCSYESACSIYYFKLNAHAFDFAEGLRSQCFTVICNPELLSSIERALEQSIAE